MTLMNAPRRNWFLLIIYTIAAIGVFIAALVVPFFRSIAYAPLREWIMPPPEPIVITVLYSTEKEDWLQEVIEDFYTSGASSVNGHPIQIVFEKMGSWEINNAVLDGTRQPVLVSPASSLQIAALQDASTAQFDKSLVNPADTGACRSVVTTPLVLVAWKERADVLWGSQPPDTLWHDLHDNLVDPQGWAQYDRSDWGYIKFGHSDPLKSNSGFMTILLTTNGYYEKNSGLTSSDILTNSDYQQWFLEVENSIGQFEYSTGPLMEKMVSYGPSLYDVIAVYEATAIEQAENALGRYGELRIYYPPALLWSDHPFCILDADWVTAEQDQAARIFIDYLTGETAQQAALLDHGFRPVDQSISLDQKGSPFERYAANGFRMDLSNLPEVEIPAGNVLNNLRDFWSRNVTR